MLHTVSLSFNAPARTPAIVLDTNVVLDWLVFRNADSERLQESLIQGRIRWVASAAMRDELRHVLGRGALASWKPDNASIWAAWDRHCLSVRPLPLAGAALRLRCTDPDDQKFIDLALGHGVRWLLSKDRAVLKLARRAHAFGVEILTPSAWINGQIRT